MDYRLSVEPTNEQFVEITEHYGMRMENVFDALAFVIYRIGEENDRENRIASFRNKKAAINECKYLEHLNAPKWVKNDGPDNK